ncbi:unnamed protein product, partial [Coregonus sp. 'balchen']
WCVVFQRVEQLTGHCEDAVNLLQSTITGLESTALPTTAEEAQVLLARYRGVMGSVLEDTRLARLQLEVRFSSIKPVSASTDDYMGNDFISLNQVQFSPTTTR